MYVAGGKVPKEAVSLRHIAHKMTVRKTIVRTRRPIFNRATAVLSVSEIDEQDVATVPCDGNSYVNLRNPVHLNKMLGLVFP